MASQGATLQAYTNELVKVIEDMKDKKESVRNQIIEEEDEKNRVERELAVLTDRLEKISGMTTSVIKLILVRYHHKARC